MPGLYTHTTRTDGTILTADLYNSDHQNHINNAIPTMIDDHSGSATAMRVQTDPGEVGSESLPVSLAGELERQRFAIHEIKAILDPSLSYWYQTPTSTLLTKAIIDAKGDLLVGTAADTIARLAAGTDGQLLTVDSATTSGLNWVSRPTGTYTVRGCDCGNNPSNPNTQWDMTAHSVVLYQPSTGNTVLVQNPSLLTNNTSTSGPAANGRDQSSAFSASTFINFYWIWNGTTLATISSLALPPTGPALPSGYTHWAYGGTVRFNGSSQLVTTILKGETAFYAAGQTALSGGAATSSTSVSVSNIVPPVAKSFQLRMRLNGDSVANRTGTLEMVNGITYLTVSTFSTDKSDVVCEVPSFGQTVRYFTSNAAATVDMFILSYTLPIGGE